MAYAAMPTLPSTAARSASPTEPGSRHHSAAPTTTASADQAQPDAVAAVLGVEVAGGRAERADESAEQVRDAKPD